LRIRATPTAEELTVLRLGPSRLVPLPEGFQAGLLAAGVVLVAAGLWGALCEDEVAGDGDVEVWVHAAVDPSRATAVATSRSFGEYMEVGGQRSGRKGGRKRVKR